MRIAILFFVLFMTMPVFAENSLNKAINDCISSRITTPPGELPQLKIEKNGIADSSCSAITLDCSGEVAQTLYEAILRFATEKEFKEKDGYTQIIRFFGKNKSPPSQCKRIITGADGKELNIFHCSIILDLRESLIGALDSPDSKEPPK